MSVPARRPSADGPRRIPVYVAASGSSITAFLLPYRASPRSGRSGLAPPPPPTSTSGNSRPMASTAAKGCGRGAVAREPTSVRQHVARGRGLAPREQGVRVIPPARLTHRPGVRNRVPFRLGQSIVRRHRESRGDGSTRLRRVTWCSTTPMAGSSERLWRTMPSAGDTQRSSLISRGDAAVGHINVAANRVPIAGTPRSGRCPSASSSETPCCRRWIACGWGNPIWHRIDTGTTQASCDAIDMLARPAGTSTAVRAAGSNRKARRLCGSGSTKTRCGPWRLSSERLLHAHPSGPVAVHARGRAQLRSPAVCRRFQVVTASAEKGASVTGGAANRSVVPRLLSRRSPDLVIRPVLEGRRRAPNSDSADDESGAGC